MRRSDVKPCPLELFALGLRVGAKASAAITDDLFHDPAISSLFSGDSTQRTESLAEWLRGQRVTWDGKPDSLIQSVSDALRLRNDVVAARKLLKMATMQLRYDGITGPSVLADVLKALDGVVAR
jgi:hypothetical protein